MTVTVLSGAILMKALGIGWSLARGVRGEDRHGNIGRDHQRSAERGRGLQQVTARGARGEPRGHLLDHGSGLHRGSGFVDGGTDAHVGGAAADVAVHGAVDVRVTRLWILADERHRAHDLAGLTVAALDDVELSPGGVHRVRCIAG